MKKRQSIPNGTSVRFNIKDLREEFEESEEFDYAAYEGKKGKIDSLETYTELGDKDYEYYNVTFPDGEEMIGISGYHLTVIKS